MRAAKELVKGKDAFLNRLFTGPATADGFFEVKHNQIRVTYRGENYVLNREDVFCLATKQADGRTWYSYGGELNRLSIGERSELAAQIRRELPFKKEISRNVSASTLRSTP